MDRVEPIARALISPPPAVGRAGRIRRWQRDQEGDREEGQKHGHDGDDASDGAQDDGLPHIDVLA